MLAILKYVVMMPRIFGHIARQPASPWQPFCSPLVGGHPHVSPEYEVDRTTRY